MVGIKPIETGYKGYLFRSRLEARWAVFFDTLGLEWVYEAEGFEFENGTRYLPDFWLPQVKMWAEVKANRFTPEERWKAEMIAVGTGFPVLMLIGVPENKPYWAVERDGSGEVGTCDYCLTMYHGYPVSEGRFYCMPGDYSPDGDAYWDDTEAAATAARSARFGERRR